MAKRSSAVLERTSYQTRTCKACFENAACQDSSWTASNGHRGYEEKGPACLRWHHDSLGCRAYSAQITFGKRVRALLANAQPWQTRPVPMPSEEYRPGDENGTRAIYTLLESDGAAYRAFRRAIAR